MDEVGRRGRAKDAAVVGEVAVGEGGEEVERCVPWGADSESVEEGAQGGGVGARWRVPADRRRIEGRAAQGTQGPWSGATRHGRCACRACVCSCDQSQTAESVALPCRMSVWAHRWRAAPGTVRADSDGMRVRLERCKHAPKTRRASEIQALTARRKGAHAAEPRLANAGQVKATCSV